MGRRSSPERSTLVATEVQLPVLGESVNEGTITAWLVKVGDHVEMDQPLFELSSDKIDTEVPSPAAGVLQEIKVDVDETVDVGTVVAIIAEEDEAAQGEAETRTPETPPAETGAVDAGAGREVADVAADEVGERRLRRQERDAATEREDRDKAEPESARGPEWEPGGDGQAESRLMSPIVRRLVAEHDLDVSQITGSGEGGRITRQDVEEAIARRREAEAKEPSQPAPGPSAKAVQPPGRAEEPRQPTRAADEEGRVRVEDLSRVRKRIAAKMIESMQSTAQLTTVQEADVTRIMTLRARTKERFRDREGVSLSPFAFMCRAAVLAIRSHPMINARPDWDAGKVTYFRYVNLGIAVDTERGLIVPNVKNADDLSLSGLARAIRQAADKARGKGNLEMHDIEGGTFTVTNIGSRGALMDTPILNYPEVAILGTGSIVRRPVVTEDRDAPSIAIRDMAYLCLTYDHQLIDGADAARYVSAVKEVLEAHDWAAEIGYDD
ncbi:MAG: 2-oxoglutarate dehydrogenase, E2 component, dihydrolipoamide succinyltransferase [Actinomycetota bacterium]|nr:2-oxoglutarate dehydrogenase, E2 component, dihydrolipoamide succinyltransferase [Actinomycetota bacterium]